MTESKTTSAKRFKLGISGARGMHYMPGFLDIPDVEVVAFCDPNEGVLKTLGDKYAIPRRYRIFDDMCASDLDAVFVASPMQLHVPQTITALEANKHVLCEVTAAVTMDELFWLKEVVEASDRTYMLCENYLYRPDVVLMQAMVDKGLFGELYFAECEYLEDIKSWIARDGKKTWRQYWQFGKRGAFYPTHSLAPVHRMFGKDPIDEISCFGAGRTYTDPQYRQEDTTTTMIRLKSGKTIRLRIDCISNRPCQITYYAIQGTKGAVETGRGNEEQKEMSKVFLSDGGTGDSHTYRWQNLWDYSELLPDNYRNMPEAAKEYARHGDYFCAGGDYYVVRDFIAALRGEKKSPVDVYEACEWTAVGLLAELSAQNGGRAMKMPNFRGARADLEYKI